MKIEFVNSSRERMPKALLSRWLESCEAKLPIKDRKRLKKADVVIAFVGRAKMAQLNAQFRGKKYATDVLSFESMEPDSLGEIVISPQVIRAQAKRTGLTYHQELAYMVLHGVLHLLGYDHETSESDAKKMFALQDGIFGTLAGTFKFK